MHRPMDTQVYRVIGVWMHRCMEAQMMDAQVYGCTGVWRHRHMNAQVY